jgi:O-antigen/teichoic acid export membrane protein
LPKAGNSFAADSLSIFLVRFSPLLVSTIIIIFFSRLLDTHDYGVYQHFWAHFYLLNSIACLGLQVFIVTYPPVFIADLFRRLKTKYYAGFGLWLLVVSSLFAWLQYDALQISWIVPQFFLIVFSLSIIVESVLVASKSFKILIATNICYAIVFGLAHWMLLKKELDLRQLFAAILFMGLIRLLIYIVAANKHMQQHKAGSDQLAYEHVRSLWMYLGFYEVSQMAFKWMDKSLIAFLLPAGMFAIYFNGAIEIPFLAVILGAVGNAALLQLAGAKAENNTEDALRLSNQSARLLSAIVFPAFFFFLFFKQELFVVLLSEKYLDSVPVFGVYVLAMPLYAYHLTSILQNRHKGAIINAGAVLDILLALTLMYPLYSLLGLPGIALSCVISSYAQASFYLYQTGKELRASVLKLLPLWNWLMKLVLFLLIFVIAHYVLSIYFAQQGVLILGILLVAIVMIVSVLLEIKATRLKYAQS